MRVALVSPYSYTYPGGVGRHVEALASELFAQGHEVRLLAPYDPDDRLARVTHRGARPERRPLPDYLIPLGRTMGLPMNGAVSNLGVFPETVGILGKELRTGGYDVVHVHEPNAPYASWYATEAARQPTVATFHTYSTSWLVGNFTANIAGARRLYSKLSARIAVSEAAEWTARRFYGGRYSIVPNGVDLSAARPDPSRPNGALDILFAGRHEPRKGLHVLLRAWPEIQRRTGARLRVAGPDPMAVRLILARLRVPEDGIDILGFLSQETLTEELLAAKAMIAPSLGGESFGMVLTRAFACATPVVASDIAGYRDVMTEETSVAVPPGDPDALVAGLVALLEDEPRRRALGAAARELAVERYSWDDVARRLEEIYLGLVEPVRVAA